MHGITQNYKSVPASLVDSQRYERIPRRLKAGSLEGMANMPLDVLLEVRSKSSNPPSYFFNTDN